MVINMIRLLINGIGGRMGGELAELTAASENKFTLAAGVDIRGGIDGVECFGKITDVTAEADCVIDFSHHSAVRELLEYCIDKKMPAVIATTGHTDEELSLIRTAAEHIPVFFARNMSLGVALLCELAKITARAMPEADIEIVEVHHNRKLDSPSGTAVLIADAIKSVRSELCCVAGRSGGNGRAKNELGIHSVRVGNVVGEHCVIVGTDSETITLKHEAHERSLFARGALKAAEFIVSKEKGLYGMEDMIRD